VPRAAVQPRRWIRDEPAGFFQPFRPVLLLLNSADDGVRLSCRGSSLLPHLPGLVLGFLVRVDGPEAIEQRVVRDGAFCRSRDAGSTSLLGSTRIYRTTRIVRST